LASGRARKESTPGALRLGDQALQRRLQGLNKSSLIQDNTGEVRVYRCPETGQIYHSVTNIISKTNPPEQQKRLENWLKRPGSEQDRDMAAARGTAAHNQIEYILKTSQKLCDKTVAQRGSRAIPLHGLARPPLSITRWAIKKVSADAPRLPWSASGWGRGLREFCREHISSIHAVEFKIKHPAGFAGTSDGLLGLKFDDEPTQLTLVDWKTSGGSRLNKAAIENKLVGYSLQAGAYSLGLKECIGLEVPQFAIVMAYRSGPCDVYRFDREELDKQETLFLERCSQYYEDLQG
jgi:hypothetical protein